jgi:hypothetical protein
MIPGETGDACAANQRLLENIHPGQQLWKSWMLFEAMAFTNRMEIFDDLKS